MKAIKRVSTTLLFSAMPFAPFAKDMSCDSPMRMAPASEFGNAPP